MHTFTISLLLLFPVLANSTNKSYTGVELYKELRRYIRTLLVLDIGHRFKKEETMCQGRYNEIRDHTSYCHCDVNCESYGDCCYDYWKNNVNKTLENSNKDATLSCMTDVYRNQTQLYWYTNSTSTPRIRGHMVTSTCPSDVIELQKKCLKPNLKNILERIPVEGSDNKTYRNIYCAECHGHVEANIKYWRYEFLCPLSKICDDNSLSNLNKCLGGSQCSDQENQCLYDECTWYVVPPYGVSKTHTICSPVIATCPYPPVINVSESENKELTSKCETYMLVVYHSGTFYKNIHCALCHGVELIDLEVPPTDYDAPTLSLFFEVPKPKFKANLRNLNSNQTNSNISRNATSSSHENKELAGEQYLTLTGFMFSTVSLLFLVVLYSMVKTLRTKPGKIIIGVSISLLFYEMVLLVSPTLTDKAVACSVVAMILHLSILSAFAWMGVMSFDVWKTFGQKSHLSIVKSKSTFRFYCLFTIVEPLLIVGLATIFDQTGVISVYWRSNDIDSSTKCWILTSLSHLVFFLLPIGLSLTFNVVALLWTIYGITKVKKETSRLNEDKHIETTNNLKMYGKLSVVMGITWVLGFTIEYSDVMKYIYVIVNSFQGFFIFLAFVVNKRVYEKYKNSKKNPSKTTGWTSAAKSNGQETRNKIISANTQSMF